MLYEHFIDAFSFRGFKRRFVFFTEERESPAFLDRAIVLDDDPVVDIVHVDRFRGAREGGRHGDRTRRAIVAQRSREFNRVWVGFQNTDLYTSSPKTH